MPSPICSEVKINQSINQSLLSKIYAYFNDNFVFIIYIKTIKGLYFQPVRIFNADPRLNFGFRVIFWTNKNWVSNIQKSIHGESKF